MDINVQTGLRIPEERYLQLKKRAEEIGISINALILMLVEIGITLVENGFILPSQQ